MKRQLKQVVVASFYAMLASNQVLAVGYRENTPPTLTPEQEYRDSASSNTNNFAAYYKAKGKPRIALFWNREQSDVLVRQNESVSYSNERLSTTETEDEVATYSGEHTFRDFDGVHTTVKKQVSGERDDNLRAGLNEKADVLLRTAFRNAFASAGIQLVDRNMMLRTAASAMKSNDAQLSEIKGLVDKADWLVELVLVQDNYAPLGYGFRVSVKNIKNSTVITEFYTKAIPPSSNEVKIIAVPGQGFKQAYLRPSVSDIGNQLALEVMNELDGIP